MGGVDRGVRMRWTGGSVGDARGVCVSLANYMRHVMNCGRARGGCWVVRGWVVAKRVRERGTGGARLGCRLGR